MPAPLPPDGATWSVLDRRVIPHLLGEVEEQLRFLGEPYRIKAKMMNQAAAPFLISWLFD
ncbi:hypothetical protein [Nonomuraea sp. LPB2021202275-12-8]|uniref:hypothetical protein n=1 Tax=Nonomuraea sp. LPB2021202275-12-8 TaxID=3120159 RepID=UPI00300CFA77